MERLRELITFHTGNPLLLGWPFWKPGTTNGPSQILLKEDCSQKQQEWKEWLWMEAWMISCVVSAFICGYCFISTEHFRFTESFYIFHLEILHIFEILVVLLLMLPTDRRKPQGGQGTCLRSHSWQLAELWIQLRVSELFCCKSHWFFPLEVAIN